jgi:hypothetical protein
MDAEAASGKSPVGTLRGCRRQQPRIPDQRDGDRAAAKKVDDERVVCEVNALDAFTWLDG